jgi:hypothetical protein
MYESNNSHLPMDEKRGNGGVSGRKYDYFKDELKATID